MTGRVDIANPTVISNQNKATIGVRLGAKSAGAPGGGRVVDVSLLSGGTRRPSAATTGHRSAIYRPAFCDIGNTAGIGAMPQWRGERWARRVSGRVGEPDMGFVCL